MKRHFPLTGAVVAFFSMASNASTALLNLDVTRDVPAATSSPLGQGTTTSTDGHTINCDSRSFFLDGQPWIPVVGEFHFSRYPNGEWRDELLKMKAGGLNTVSTYVFWIHHEEEQGKFDWNGQRSLRDFLKLCREVRLKVLVRMGPWDHGEVRNGGFPDWLLKSGCRLRSTDPAFMKHAGRLFREEARQMAGLLWKDGGPVIGVQLDNECDDGNYLLALKELARSVGVDVPFYVITGWQGGVPKAGLLPLFGGYCDGFWGGSHEDYRKEFLFTDTRALNDLGPQLTSKNPENAKLLAQFPYACVELGPGMMSGYDRRIKIVPDDVAALTLAKLGSGNNMPGYYMYHGGVNPEGKLSNLQEDHPNRLPVKDYDFQTALGSFGQVREQYHLLREQHLFLQDFGGRLARMAAFFPEQRPASLKDFVTLRWNVRSDGESGFLFYSNRQPYEPLPDHKGVQFTIRTAAGSLLIPRQPVTIPSGSYGIWPFNIDCDGVTLEYATAQLVCRSVDGHGAPVYFFTAIPEIEPELLLRADPSRVLAIAAEKEVTGNTIRVHHINAGTTPATRVTTAAGTTVTFVVLTPAQGRRLWRVSFAGRNRLILSDATVLADGADLRLQVDKAEALEMSMFPPVPSVTIGEKKLKGSANGIFARFTPENLPMLPTINTTVTQERTSSPNLPKFQGTNDEVWNDASVYTLNLPAISANRHILLDLHYTGDAARIYIGGKLFNDHFYNGDPISVGLWRIPSEQRSKVRLKVLPYIDALRNILPEEARRKVDQAKAKASLNSVTVSVKEQTEVRIKP